MSYEGSVVFFCVGNSADTVERFGINPWKLLGDKGVQKLMLVLAEKARTKDELRYLATSLQLQKLDMLVKHKLVKKVGHVYTPAIPVVTNAKARSLKKMLKPVVEAVSRVVEERLDELKSAYSKSPVSDNFPWSKVAHIIVDALLLDFSMLSCRENLLARYGLYSDWSKDQLLIPFFGMQISPEMANLGVNSAFLGSLGVSVMHGSMIRRNPPLHQVMKMIGDEAKALVEIYEGNRPDKAPKLLIRAGIVKCKETCTLAVPLLKDKDKEALTGAIIEVAHEAAEKLVSQYGVVKQAYSKLGYSKSTEGIGDFAELAFHMVMALSVEKLTHMGVLPPIPEAVPPSWGVWFWTSPWTLDYKAIYHHIAKEIKETVARQGINSTIEKQISEAEALAQEGRYGEALAKIKKVIYIYKN